MKRPRRAPRRARYLLAKVQNTLTCIKLPSKLMRDARVPHYAYALCVCLWAARGRRAMPMRYGILRVRPASRLRCGLIYWRLKSVSSAVRCRLDVLPLTANMSSVVPLPLVLDPRRWMVVHSVDVSGAVGGGGVRVAESACHRRSHALPTSPPAAAVRQIVKGPCPTTSPRCSDASLAARAELPSMPVRDWWPQLGGRCSDA